MIDGNYRRLGPLNELTEQAHSYNSGTQSGDGKDRDEQDGNDSEDEDETDENQRNVWVTRIASVPCRSQWWMSLLQRVVVTEQPSFEKWHR